MSARTLGVLLMASSLVWFTLAAYIGYETYVMYKTYKAENSLKQ